jgi:hypothetical protein
MNEDLSVRQAYEATFAYLLDLYLNHGIDQLGGVLGDMSFLEDGTTADPAAWQDWLRAVERAKLGEVDTTLDLD